jgi:formylglycine-generating enzyme required for sulfatase activity/energy-coupling factor transporter ATP-binding protein EcfA2
MTNSPRHLRIFLSSPGDVADERALALRVLEQLPTDPLLRGRVTFEAIAWDKPGASAPMLANMTPQEAINQGLPKPSECDIVAVIFWSRMGTPLPPEEVKADGARFLSGTEWEYEDAMQGARKVKSPQILVYRRTEEPIIGLRDPERNLKIEQWERVEAFFSAFTNADGSIRQGFNTYKQPDEFREQFENHMKALVARILESAPKTKSSPMKRVKKTEPWKGSPFPGLRAFTEEDSAIYFGRGREVDGLIQKLTENKFVAVVGASGSGKSSLVGAGLIPRLKSSAIENSQDWDILPMKPGVFRTHQSFQYTVSHEQTNLSSAQESMIKDVESFLDNSANGLLDVAESIAHNAQRETLFVVDQFEELFTLVEAEHRKRFIDIVTHAATNSESHVRVMVTLRADFYAKCIEYPGLAELLRTGSFPMSAPGPGSLYQMITRPAALAGLEFEDGLPERILDDTGGDPGALPLMAYALDELYHACEKTKRLTHAAYDAFGGVQGAIGTRAESVFNALPAETQATLPDVFRHLVEVDERGISTRKRANLKDLGSDDAIRLADALTNARLLMKSSGENNQPVIEVAHEALLRSWPRLAGWIEMVRDDLYMLRMVRTAADDWARSGRQRTFLWPHERLNLVYDVLARLNHPPLDEITSEFIRPEAERLIVEINDPATLHARRVAIGDRLAEIGDPRPGVGLGPDGVPDFDWCKVPGGTVSLEKDAGTFKVKPFYVSRYLVTYAQYRAFVEAEDGYYNKKWWEALVKRKDETPPGQQRFPILNHPVENVSWNDAVAFCRWVSAKLGYEIRLPMEFEWQQAATGGSDNVYPWGPEWDSERANTTKGGLYRTTSVGMYQHGASPVGAMDMSGNVKEWCLNEFNSPGDIAYHSENLRRTVRGGSYVHGTDFARSAARNDTNVGGRNEYTGFRVICTKPK